VPFSRTEEGKIYQRAFGGMMRTSAKGPPVQRTCAAADRTGHAILHTLYGQSLRTTRVLHRVFRARPDHGRGRRLPGVIAWKLDDGTMHRFRAQKMVVLATGGYGRAYFSAPRPTPAPATATAWCCAPACRCRTWNSCSSTRPASTAPAA
jgi:succinate dehydrogenase / fumarate reductase flavoprotein subunit